MRELQEKGGGPSSEGPICGPQRRPLGFYYPVKLALAELVGDERETDDGEQTAKGDEHAERGGNAVRSGVAPIGGRHVLREVPDRATVGGEKVAQEDERDDRSDDDGSDRKGHCANRAEVRRFVLAETGETGEAPGVVRSRDEFGKHGKLRNP